MSPFLKHSLPLACLGTEAVQEPPISDSKKQNDGLATTGLKLQALSSAADSILKSATQLEEEMKREAKYWDQVLAIKDKGWAISRMPKERHNLGVRFGFLESPPEFQDKGVASLRRGDDGAVELELGTNATGTKLLMARVLENNLTVAVSSDDSDDRMDDDSADTQSLKARNSVFDSELFSELYREARGLANRGVKCVGDRITLALGNNATLIVELVDQTIKWPKITAVGSSQQYKQLPQLMVTALRLLLSHSHRQNYLRRTAQPPLISERRLQRPLPSVLHPILSYVQHRPAVQGLINQLRQIKAFFKNAGLELEVGAPQDKFDLSRLLKSKGLRGKSSFVHAFLQGLCSPLQTTISVKASVPTLIADLQSIQRIDSPCQLALLVSTHDANTQYEVTLSPSTTASTGLSLPKVKDPSNASYALDIIVTVLQAHIMQSLISSSNKQLESLSPLVGDLNTKPHDGQYHQMVINLSTEQLILKHAFVDEVRPHELDIVGEWKADETSGQEGEGLVAMVRRCAQGLMETTVDDSGMEDLF